MELINTIVKFISDVGASAMLPFVIAVLGLYFRIKESSQKRIDGRDWISWN